MNLMMATIPRKSIWKPMHKGVWQFFCPQCRTPQKLPYSPKPERMIRVFQVLLTAGIFTLLTWDWFEWKGIVSFFPFWAAFELVYRILIRSKLSCQSCGFDPYLYLSDVPRARAEIEHFWRKKFEAKGIPYPGDDEEEVVIENNPEEMNVSGDFEPKGQSMPML